MLTGKPPMGHLEPAAAMLMIALSPTKPTLPESVSQDAEEFIQAALTWLVILTVRSKVPRRQCHCSGIGRKRAMMCRSRGSASYLGK